MKMEDVKIEDAADANYVIKKFFNNDLSKIKMAQLEQLVLAVYAMGKNSGAPAETAPVEAEPKPEAKAPAKAAVLKINDRVKLLEDVEIGHSGEFIKAGSECKVNTIKGDNITALFEMGEEGEMHEISISLDKLEKISGGSTIDSPLVEDL